MLKAENKAKSTVYNYGNHITGYIRWCEQRGEEPRIDRALVTDWLAQLLTDGIEPATSPRRHRAEPGSTGRHRSSIADR